MLTGAVNILNMLTGQDFAPDQAPRPDGAPGADREPGSQAAPGETGTAVEHGAAGENTGPSTPSTVTVPQESKLVSTRPSSRPTRAQRRM